MSSNRQRCFVVMGFGIKTDFATGRKLDLNKSYQFLIKPVVEERGLECVRADEIRHSGAIDVPMYRELLTADVVIADLSTANPNALYELGVRHALRPRTTIVISENKLPYPFDLNHINITSYAHLGETIGYDEVLRFREELGKTLDAVLSRQDTDSPVYTFLGSLVPPTLRKEAAEAVERAGEALKRAGDAISLAAPDLQPQQDAGDDTIARLVDQGEQAIKESRFVRARERFATVLELAGRGSSASPISGDTYLIQRLVLATYKAKEPDEVSALQEALGLLEALRPAESNDPETLGLAGAIEKRLFDQGQGHEHLDRAIRFYARGYYLRNDWYNGINFAYLLTLRADTPLDATTQEKIADMVCANRVRRDVVALCERDLRTMREGRQLAAGSVDGASADELRARATEQEFWCLATLAEAQFGLGDLAGYEKTRGEATELAHASWMMETFDGQVAKLRPLLQKHSHLLGAPPAELRG